MSTKKELRIIKVPTEGLELRDGGENLPTIAGYTAVYDQETRIGSAKAGFREVIRRGFFTRAINERHDVRALFNHNSDNILARSKNGTLKMREDSRGLFVEFEPADTQAGRDTVTSIRRGDVDGMSFAFTTKTVRWTEDDEDPANDLRELLEIEQLYDVGPVVYPAYEQTTADLASFRSSEDIRGEELVPERRGSVQYKRAKEGIMIPTINIPTSFTISVPRTFRVDLPKISGIISREKTTEQRKRARERELELLELE